ncbi:hypothetical protein GCM10022220_56890 [Actinocatenispora rupis]
MCARGGSGPENEKTPRVTGGLRAGSTDASACALGANNQAAEDPGHVRHLATTVRLVVSPSQISGSLVIDLTSRSPARGHPGPTLNLERIQLSNPARRPCAHHR